MINLDKVSEGIHYELTPVEENPNEQAWHVRILEGEFAETVITFGNVALHEDGDHLSFNFALVSSPDDTLNEDYEPLQNFAAEILEDIMERAIADGSIAFKDQEKE